MLDRASEGTRPASSRAAAGEPTTLSAISCRDQILQAADELDGMSHQGTGV
jgi:hypothetical protein